MSYVQKGRGNSYWLPVQVFLLPPLVWLPDVGLERNGIYSFDGDPRGDPRDAGPPGAAHATPDHGVVEITCCHCDFRPHGKFSVSSLEDWREVEAFVRAGRDICDGFQSLFVWLEVVPTFREDRLE